MDEIRNNMTKKLRTHLVTQQAKIRDAQRDRIDLMHSLMHEFMRDMDRAVLIHEQIALLDGRDPKDVNGALWPVRTKPR